MSFTATVRSEGRSPGLTWSQSRRAISISWAEHQFSGFRILFLFGVRSTEIHQTYDMIPRACSPFQRGKSRLPSLPKSRLGTPSAKLLFPIQPRNRTRNGISQRQAPKQEFGHEGKLRRLARPFVRGGLAETPSTTSTGCDRWSIDVHSESATPGGLGGGLADSDSVPPGRGNPAPTTAFR